MFEGLFEKKSEQGVSLEEPAIKKGGMFEGLFKKPPDKKPPEEKGFYVSLTPDLKSIKIEDTGETIPREEFTSEMKTAYKGLMGQLIETQKETRKEIPTTYGGIIKQTAKDIWKGIKAIPKTVIEWPGEVGWKGVLAQEAGTKEMITGVIPEATAKFFTGGYKGVSQTLIGLGNIFTKILPYSEEQKKRAAEEAKALQQEYAITDIAEIPGYVFEKIAEIGVASGITNKVLLKTPTIARFASTYPKIYSSLSFGVTGTTLGQIRMETDASWQQRLKQASIDFSSWTAWGAVGGIPTKAFYKYMPAYFTIGYASAILEGKEQEDAIVTGISSAAIGSIFKIASIPKKTHDVMIKNAKSTFKKYGTKDFTKESYYKLAHKYHPDKPGGSHKAMMEINVAYKVLSKSPKQLERGIMGEFKSLIKSIVKRPIPTKRAIVPFVPPIEPTPPLVKPTPTAPVVPKPKIARKPIFEGLFEKPEVKPAVTITIKPEKAPIKPAKEWTEIEIKKWGEEYKEALKKAIPPKEKLPEIKKPPKEEGKLYGVMIMPDPGLDKFLVEEVRPILNKAMEAGKFLLKEARYIPEFMMRIIEPAKLVAGKPYAMVIRGIHKPEARLVEFDQKRLEAIDINISELEKWFDKFSDKDLENLMLTRGKTSSLEARRIQIKAFAEISKELKVPIVKKAIQEIADFNYKFLQEVAGKDIHKVEDYFYGMYKDSKMVSKFLDYWRSTEKFTKRKIFPTVADAEAYGLELRYKNPVTNLRAEFRAIAKLEGMNWMKEELLRTGKGIYIEEVDKAPIAWEKVNDPVFRDLRVEPNLARLINNLISTNKIARIPVLNTLRKINNFLRTIKFIGSAFHMGVIGKQSVADSGYLGFAYKKTATKGATFGFRKNDPIFQTPEYKQYIELGGGHKYSLEFEAKRALSTFVDKINRGNYLGAFTKLGIFPAKIPAGFVNWMFNNYIPKVKYAKYLDFVAKREKDLDRITTDKEKIEIMKEGQNFYGMMNERLFGRSGTVTTALRFFFMAPGFAEGNYRTIIKAFSQWGVKGTYGAGRSRFNIVNSLLLTAILATIGTLAFTKKPPEKPKKLEDIRDLFKIDTGYVDDKGRKIMIDLMTYDKDYWNVTFNILRGRPDKAITESITRVGGMKAATYGILTDFSLMLQGRAIYDWKGDEVVELTDPFFTKVMKIAIHEIKKLEPISVSVYKQTRRKNVDRLIAAVEAMIGLRPTYTEEEKRRSKIIQRIYSLKGQQEELYQYLGTIDHPKEAIEDYNKTVNDILDSKMVPSEMREEWKPKLLVDIDRLLSNKVYGLTDPMTRLTAEEKEKEIEKIKKYLNNFGVSIEEAEERLVYYWKEHPVKDKWSKTHRENVRNRKIRLKERY